MRSGKVADVYRVERGRRRRHPVARHRRVEPAVAFRSTGNGYHTIACVRSGKVLDVAGFSADGAAVVQRTADGRTSRQWQLRPQTGGEFVLVNRNSGKVLDVKGGSTADGVALIQYRDVGSSDRRWTFHRVTGWGP
ncbi:RICIN domain-containing protein [Streptomyces bullii]|uniref:RICIN domain-containing protein n=1 Tax=Streptomyces bullii TaxID=349910 RepID=A0ABW0UUU5_9ACTN